MKIKSSFSRKVFIVLNTVLLTSIALCCLLPLIYVLAVSFSGKAAVSANQVGLLPVDFNLQSYQYIIGRPVFWRAFGVSVVRCAVGVAVNLTLICLTAYPLSKTKQELRCRTFMSWFFVITLLFSGGLIPSYMVVYSTGLIDSFWALIFPEALNVYNMILMINFMRTIPKSMEESARLDGAGELTILARIVLPNLLPSIATLCIFTVVWHWNSWFDGMIYMNNMDKFPLQTYLQAILITQKSSIVSRAAAVQWQNISGQAVKSAQVTVAAVPVLIIYPFLQRYFMSGMTMGSVKE